MLIVRQTTLVIGIIDGGDREMVKKILVYSCEDCPHRMWEEGEFCEDGRLCELTGDRIEEKYFVSIRRIPDVERIPDWCPLDEVKVLYTLEDYFND